jgi:hypothetical protein
VRTLRGRRGLRIGILDLIARRPVNTPYSRLMYPSFASLMPQAIGVWAERLGHHVHYVPYVGYEDLARELPDDLDVLFVSAFTPAAYLAYAIANLYRRAGTVTVLGGPHANAFPCDACQHFDYVVQATDEKLVGELLAGCEPQREGVVLAAPGPPAELPGLRERWRFARVALARGPLPGAVPLVASLGCPYRCSFCVDANVPYQTFPEERIRDDLAFLQQVLRVPAASWHDSNFGVRFDAMLDLIEESTRPGAVRFIAESSLSLLSEPRLRRLRKNGFAALVVGIESWFGFNDKAKQGRRVGREKVDRVAEQVDLITRYVPYTQANFVWGFEEDAGPEPFELTRRFVERAPAAFPSHSLLTAFGRASPLAVQMREAGRVLSVPFHVLDASVIHNVKLGYATSAFYARLAEVVAHSYSQRASARRFLRSHHGLGSAGRWLSWIRSRASAFRCAHYRELAQQFAHDREFQRFDEGGPAPAALRHGVKRDLGRFYDALPPALTRALERGETPLHPEPG